MTTQTIYLISGANRGIGLGLTATLLLRPNTSVIATIRSTDTPTAALTALPKAGTSTLLILPFSTTTAPDTFTATLITHGIPHINTLISNAGTCSPASFQPVLTTSPAALLADFQTNTILPLLIFQAAFPLLKKSISPKFVFVSSSLGSIGDMEGAVPSTAYGVSKVGANYLVRKAHFEGEREELVAFAVHPGWVRTEMGQAFADAVGVGAPPMAMEECVEGVLKQIDGATREATSGKFVSYDDSVMQW